MLNFLGRPRGPIPPTPWLKWLVLGFLGFAMVSSMYRGTPDSPGKVHMAVEQAKEDLAPGNLINFGEYRNILNPAQTGELRMRDIKTGTGGVAVCGQKVSIAYETFLVDSTNLPDTATKNKPFTFLLGAGKAMPVFEQGVIGMSEGGVRSLLAPPNMTYAAPGFARENMPSTEAVRFDIEMLSITPALPDIATSPYRIMVTRSTGGKLVRCGEAANLNVTIWSIDGKKLFVTKKPITFTPGSSELPIGIEQGAIGMSQGGMRTLILPPAFRSTMDGSPSSVEFPWPKDQTVLVDIEAVP